MSDAVPPETTRVTGASVACVGEAMIMLCPDDGQPLESTERMRRSVGGAEANVARMLSSLGVHTSFG